MAVTKVKSKSKTKSKSKKIAKNGKNKTMKKNINKTMRGGVRGITNLRKSARGITNSRYDVYEQNIKNRRIEKELREKSIAATAARIEEIRRQKAASLGSSTVPSKVPPRVKSSFFSGFSGFFNKKLKSQSMEPIKVKSF
jgi:hypothetical protein